MDSREWEKMEVGVQIWYRVRLILGVVRREWEESIQGTERTKSVVEDELSVEEKEIRAEEGADSEGRDPKLNENWQFGEDVRRQLHI